MKKLILTVVSFLTFSFAMAQAPGKMSYQAVIRNNINTLVTNQSVGMRISILQGSASGSSVYIETQAPSSNANGLVSIEIGGGTIVSGNFSTIDWANGPYFVKTETDPAGGSNYSITGTSQLLSMPYALYAEKSGTPGPKGDKGEQGIQGISGPKGDKGDTGTQGIQGVAGAKGDTGSQGLKGDTGDTGAQGIQGVAGAKGDTGAQGLKGDKGDQGIQGVAGPKGDTGAQGLKGDKGDTGNGYQNGTATNQISYWNGSTWVVLNPGTVGQTLTLCENGLTWTTGGICPTANVTDVSGNAYPTVKIGTQTWMNENLRTTKYSDGTNIPLVTDNTQWANNYNNSTQFPMMSWYNNDQATYTTNKYGALYNWYAVSPTTNGNKNVCPTGWHLPADAEWTTLTDYLGGESVAGGKMKSTGTQFWNSPNTGATNESGLTSLPVGFRSYNSSSFAGIGSDNAWWSSSESNSEHAWIRSLIYNSGTATRNDANKNYGFSVRCLKD